MKLSHIAAAVVFLGLASFQTQAQSVVLPVSLEQGHEVAPFMIRMPTTSTGELTLQICTACKVLRLRVSEQTQYFIGKEPVTLADITKYFNAHPVAPTVVVQRKDTDIVNRVTVSASYGGGK
jgi:hypothetical protein